MHTAYTKAEFIEKYDGKSKDKNEDKTLENFFKHIDRHTPDFFKFFSINPNLIQNENSRQYEIPSEVAELLAGLIRAHSSAYGTDRRKGKANHGFLFTYEEYHTYMESLRQEMEKMQPYQRELIKNHRCYRNARIIDRFLPMVIDRIAMLIVTLFCYQPNQSSDDFIEVISKLDHLIESLFNSRSEEIAAGGESIANQQEYTFEDAISMSFRILCDDKYSFPKQDQIQVTSPEFVVNTLKAKRTLSKKLKKQAIDSKGDTREAINRQLNEIANRYAEKNIEFENQLNDAASFYKGFWDAERLSDRLTKELLMETREHTKIAIDMALGIGGYADIINDIEKGLKKRAIEDIEDGHFIALGDSVADLKIYQEFHELFPMFRDRVNHGYAAGREYEEVRSELAEEQCQRMAAGAEFVSASVIQDSYRDAFCRYTQEVMTEPVFKIAQEQLGKAVAQLLPVHFQPRK